MESGTASEDKTSSVQFSLEILLLIFKHVDPHTLVFSCRHVCRYWREAVENCGSLWKMKICEARGKDSPLLNAFLDYPWYVCYAMSRNVFENNLFTDFEVIPANPPFWREADSPGFIWSTPFDDCTVGFPPLPPELVGETTNPSFMGTVGECRANYMVDLYKKGLTRKLLGLQPPIQVSEWFAARFDYCAFSHFEVKLFNSEWQCDLEHGYYIHQQRIGWRTWQHVTYTFTNYNPDIRYVVLHHGIETCLPHFFGPTGHLEYRSAASKIAGTKVIVGLPDTAGSSSSASTSSE